MFFNRNKKKHIINSAILDLRKYTPQALENVKMINAACVIFSNNPSEELMTAYGNIRTKNIAKTLNLDEDKKIVSFNGTTLLNQTNYTENAIHMTNGICVIQKIESDNPIEVFSNGLTIYDPNVRMNFIVQNGLSIKIPFGINDAKIFSADALIDSQFIENISDNTVVVAGANMVISREITLDLLKSKHIYFVAGAKIKCDSSILGYIQTIATAGKKIEVNG